MGIGSNWSVEIAESDHDEALFEEVILEATARFMNGEENMQSAFEGAQVLIEEQQEAIRKGECYTEDDTNIIGFVDSSLEGSVLPKDREAEVASIADKFRDQFS